MLAGFEWQKDTTIGSRPLSARIVPMAVASLPESC